MCLILNSLINQVGSFPAGDLQQVTSPLSHGAWLSLSADGSVNCFLGCGMELHELHAILPESPGHLLRLEI